MVEFIDRRHYSYFHRETIGAAREQEYQRWLDDYSAICYLCTQLRKRAIVPDTTKANYSAEIDTNGNTPELNNMPENLKLQRDPSFQAQNLVKVKWSCELAKVSNKLSLIALEYNKAKINSYIHRLQTEAE